MCATAPPAHMSPSVAQSLTAPTQPPRQVCNHVLSLLYARYFPTQLPQRKPTGCCPPWFNSLLPNIDNNVRGPVVSPQVSISLKTVYYLRPETRGCEPQSRGGGRSGTATAPLVCNGGARTRRPRRVLGGLYWASAHGVRRLHGGRSLVCGGPLSSTVSAAAAPLSATGAIFGTESMAAAPLSAAGEFRGGGTCASTLWLLLPLSAAALSWRHVVVSTCSWFDPDFFLGFPWRHAAARRLERRARCLITLAFFLDVFGTARSNTALTTVQASSTRAISDHWIRSTGIFSATAIAMEATTARHNSGS